MFNSPFYQRAWEHTKHKQEIRIKTISFYYFRKKVPFLFSVLTILVVLKKVEEQENTIEVCTYHIDKLRSSVDHFRFFCALLIFSEKKINETSSH